MFTLEDYNKRYEVVKSFSIELSPDPVSEGLDSLTAKLSEIQRLRNRVSAALTEAIRNKSESEIDRDTVKNNLDMKMAELKITDEFVRSHSSDKKMDAAAMTKCPDLLLQMHAKEVELIRAETYEKFVNQIHENLDAANTNLSRQISVIQSQIKLGEIDPSYLPKLKVTNGQSGS